jgi:diadenosine tetraphosphate (Ap4A) HIT family hydrolase
VSAPAGPACELCATDGGALLWRDAQLRVIAVEDADYPGFLRVVWNAHEREFSDLPADARRHLCEVLYLAEQAVRAALHPDKVNLASLGNVVPHLHWHVIPRFFDDAHYPGPIWGPRRRDADPAAQARRRSDAARLPRLLAAALAPQGASAGTAGRGRT